MWNLVYSQVKKSEQALLTVDKELAYEIIAMEKKVDAFELLIDQACEDFIALHTPVAIDLRFILSCIKINTGLERIGDFAKGIANIVIVFTQKGIDRSFLIETRVSEMFTEALSMLEITKRAFESDDSKLACKVFSKDDILDEINHAAVPCMANLIAQNPQMAEQALQLASIIRKLERIGDHCNNIGEEIIFYLEAKVLKHKDVQD